jgi:hypothetical protein
VDDPKDFIFARELNEIQLLFDNLASDPEKSLVDKMKDKLRPESLGEDWIERVFAISWPPEGSEKDQAKQAALLITAKDYLNSLTKPASGGSIAFTLLVTQDEFVKEFESAPDEDRDGGDRVLRPKKQKASRICLARDSYPDLMGKARSYRIFSWWLRTILIAWLCFTLLFSWYVAHGNARLADATAAHKMLADAEGIVRNAQSGEPLDRKNAADGQKGAPAPANGQGAANAAQKPVQHYCLVSRTGLPPGKRVQYDSIPQMESCAALAVAQRTLYQADVALSAWLRFWIAPPSSRYVVDWTETNGRHVEADAAARASIWGTAVLPVL